LIAELPTAAAFNGEQGRCHLMLVNFTDQGLKGVKDVPSRQDKSRDTANQFGVDAVEQGTPIQIPDIQNHPSAALDVIVRAGFRALLLVPLLGTEGIVGALVVRRKQPGEFPDSTVELLQTFAAQSVLAIQNARLSMRSKTKAAS
jgi:GAF domain-containing protein